MHRIIVTKSWAITVSTGRDLLSGDSGVVVNTDDRGLDVETDLSSAGRAPACEPSAFGDRQVEVALHTIVVGPKSTA